ncbi:hypothetical protein BC943DRAFT_332570 [Umbelopsis sp. AD052]|nr:hypothetical protein BC943DRAFT_332570 [Umbelopsis sp. AD052]
MTSRMSCFVTRIRIRNVMTFIMVTIMVTMVFVAIMIAITSAVIIFTIIVTIAFFMACMVVVFAITSCLVICINKTIAFSWQRATAQIEVQANFQEIILSKDINVGVEKIADCFI